MHSHPLQNFPLEKQEQYFLMHPILEQVHLLKNYLFGSYYQFYLDYYKNFLIYVYYYPYIVHQFLVLYLPFV